MRTAMKLIALSIFAAGLVMAAAVLYSQRYVIAAAANDSSLWVLDRLTGNLMACGAGSPGPVCIRAVNVRDATEYGQ